MMGATAEVNYDWLTVRGTYLQSDSEIVGLPDDASFNVSSAGARADFGTFFAVSELSFLLPNEGFFNGDESWYVSAGYRLGAFTPHVTYASFDESDDSEFFETGEITTYNNIIAGLKYNFHPQASLKLEYSIVSDETSDDAIDAGDTPPGDSNLYLVALDIIF